MIVDSSNDATHYVLDVLTQTTGGFELPLKEMAKWQKKRNAVNRYFSSLGYVNINVNQKTFCEDAYGREQVSRGPNGENEKQVNHQRDGSLNDGNCDQQSHTPARSRQMMQLLQRDPTKKTSDADSQVSGLQRLGAACRRKVLGQGRLDQRCATRCHVYRIADRPKNSCSLSSQPDIASTIRLFLPSRTPLSKE